MVISFRLDTYNADSEGFCPVFLDCNYDGFRLKMSVGLKSKEKDWDKLKMKFWRSSPDYLSGNEILRSVEDRIRTAYRESLIIGVIPSTQRMRELIKPQKQKAKRLLVDEYRDFLALRRSGVSLDTHKGYNTIIYRIERFESFYGKIWLEDYSQDIHDRFRTFQIDTMKLHPNSVAKTYTYLRTFFIKLGRSKEINWQCSEIEPETIFLTRAEIEQLRTVVLPDYLARVRDSFVFSCFTGLRYGDLRTLSSESIRQRDNYSYIELVPNKSMSRMKSVKKIEEPIPARALKILDRYSGSFRSLPIISNQKMNAYLKQIAMLAGIDNMTQTIEYEKGKPTVVYRKKYELFTVHVARHTYATNSLIRGVPVEIIQKVFGHSDLKTTMRYAKIVDEYKNAVILGAWSE